MSVTVVDPAKFILLVCNDHMCVLQFSRFHGCKFAETQFRKNIQNYLRNQRRFQSVFRNRVQRYEYLVSKLHSKNLRADYSTSISNRNKHSSDFLTVEFQHQRNNPSGRGSSIPTRSEEPEIFGSNRKEIAVTRRAAISSAPRASERGERRFPGIEDRSAGGRLCKGFVNRSRTRSLGQRSEDGDSVGVHCLRLRLKDRASFRVSRGSGIDDRQRRSPLFFLSSSFPSFSLPCGVPPPLAHRRYPSSRPSCRAAAEVVYVHGIGSKQRGNRPAGCCQCSSNCIQLGIFLCTRRTARELRGRANGRLDRFDKD